MQLITHAKASELSPFLQWVQIPPSGGFTGHPFNPTPVIRSDTYVWKGKRKPERRGVQLVDLDTYLGLRDRKWLSNHIGAGSYTHYLNLGHPAQWLRGAAHQPLSVPSENPHMYVGLLVSGGHQGFFLLSTWKYGGDHRVMAYLGRENHTGWWEDLKEDNARWWPFNPQQLLIWLPLPPKPQVIEGGVECLD